jgi:hypothetical protein
MVTDAMRCRLTPNALNHGTTAYHPVLRKLLQLVVKMLQPANRNLLGTFLLALTATGCSAQEQIMPSKTTVFATLDEAKLANPSFRRLNNAQLNALFSRSIRLDFSARDTRAGGTESVRPDNEWRFDAARAVLTQAQGQWSIKDDMFCVRYQGSKGPSATTCREIWADSSAKYGIIRKSFDLAAGVVEATQRDSFYVLQFEEIIPDAAKTIR